MKSPAAAAATRLAARPGHHGVGTAGAAGLGRHRTWTWPPCSHFGTAQGFAWPTTSLTSRLLHDGGRVLAMGCWPRWPSAVVWPGPAAPANPAAERVPLAGRDAAGHAAGAGHQAASASTSCPWDLAEFGGVARYVSHWQWGG
jgi:hypothetical protein